MINFAQVTVLSKVLSSLMGAAFGVMTSHCMNLQALAEGMTAC